MLTPSRSVVLALPFLLVLACARGPVLLTGTSLAPVDQLHACLTGALDARGFEIRSPATTDSTIRAVRDRFDGEPVLDVIEVRVGEAEGRRVFEIRAEEVGLRTVRGPTSETRRDAEMVRAACAAGAPSI
jgi:hypothetical protein